MNQQAREWAMGRLIQARNGGGESREQRRNRIVQETMEGILKDLGIDPGEVHGDREHQGVGPEVRRNVKRRLRLLWGRAVEGN